MKLYSRIALVLGILAVSAAISYTTIGTRAEGSDNTAIATSGDPAKSPSKLGPCTPKSALESALFATPERDNFPNLTGVGMTGFATAKFECAPCCNGSALDFGACMIRNGNANSAKCGCIAEAYNGCLAGGCGPCQCCATWLQTGETQGCNQILNDRKKATDDTR